MINIQEMMKELFGNSCNAYCYAYISHKHKLVNEPSPQLLTSEVLKGWYNGYIKDDGYVSKPVQYFNSMQSSEFDWIRDVVKVSIHKLSELPEGLWIVEYKVCPEFKASHFVVASRSGVVFDPAGDSNTVRYGAPVSYRKLIYREAA